MPHEPSPLYFPSGDRQLFGWLGEPGGAEPRDLGVVLCKPFGYEALCAHDGLHAFAAACREAGAHTLLFDYAGTGDSGDPDGDGDDIARWCEDIHAAIDALARHAGVRRVVLAGVRLGALLAARVAAQRPVEGLVAIAPVTSGRRYVRELLAFRAASAPPGAPPAAAAAGGDATGLDVAGFMLSAATVEALKPIDLARGPTARAGAALLIDREEFPEAAAWATALRAAGVETRHLPLPGYPAMVTSPHASVVPAAMVAALRDWIAAQAARAPLRAHPGDPPPAQARLELPARASGAVVERVVRLPGGRGLFGILAAPAGRGDGAPPPARALLLLNCGATNHVGPNRMHVPMARKWAARGLLVLRMDIAGMGDSATPPGAKRNVVYPPGALRDIADALGFLRQQCGATEVTAAGVCAGAFHALRAAVTGLPVDRLLMVNPLAFYWKPGAEFTDLQVDEVMRNPGVYMANARSSRHWRKLLRGEVNLWRVFRVFVGRIGLAATGALRERLRPHGIRLGNDLGMDLQAVARRGIPMVFCFARGETGLALLHNLAGSVPGQLGDRCRVHVIDDGDHIFSAFPARAELLRLIDAELAR